MPSRPRLASSLVLPLVLAVLADTAAAQQPPSPAAKIAAIEKVVRLEGTWKGGGWMSFGPDRRMEFTSTEVVQRRLGGVVLQIEGEHRAGERVVHDALAILSFDEKTQRYRFRSYLANGMDGDFEATATETGMQWGYDHPQAGRMRYTITITPEGTWHEIGEMSRDGGQTWTQILEMTLTRK